MVTSALFCSNDIVSLIIGTHRIHCVVLKEINANQYIIQHQELILSQNLTLAQPTALEQAIRTYLLTQKIPNACVALAISAHTIAPHELLQCQLLAINTPFHCAGITTVHLAREYAYAHNAQLPKNSYGISADDVLSCIGLYIMARKSS
jgi:hypothetical protein